jgi:hypothetical protein
MEAPKKIWINPSIDLPKLNGVLDKESVQYVRKDAFIDKACEYWYQYNRDIVKKHGAKAVLGCSEFTVSVEDFKQAMEE